MSPVPLPLPLLTLRLSSPSFLETILTDAGHPVYSTETFENSTFLSRCDPVHGLTLVATIRWPEHSSPHGKSKEAPGAQVFMDGGLQSEDSLLKRKCFNTYRKFYIPGHSHSLKWKRVQGVFQCISSTGELVAVFEPAVLTARARLNVFVPSLSGLADSHGNGTSTTLVDYLIVTALLLLTHPEDWRGIAPSPSMTTSELPVLDISRSSGSPVSSQSTPVSPVTFASSDSSYSSSYPSSTYPESEFDSCHAAAPPSRTDFHMHLASVKEDVVDYEPPPPYEEIQWTVRVRQPRPRRT